MISLCTVTFGYIDKYFLSTFLKSVLENTSNVKEILIAKVDAPPSYFEETNVNGISIKRFGYEEQWQNIKLKLPGVHNDGIEHALGLHQCLDKATQEYIWITDPDCFFYKSIDECYLSLIDKFNLDMIGLSHYNSLEVSFTYFPDVINFMVKKDKLPDESFLAGKLKPQSYWMKGAKGRYAFELTRKYEEYPEFSYNFDGKYLMPGCVNSIADEYPNKNHSFETGCNLYYWGKINNWNWMSFQTLDAHLYATRYFRSYPKIQKDKKNKKLLYHVSMGHARTDTELIQIAKEFNDLYDESKED